MYILNFLGVGVAMFLADVCWAYYFINISERKSSSAGIWAVLIYMFGAFTVTSYMNDKTLIIAALIGSFLGTYCSVEYKKRKEKNK
tara:strand:- start:65 stop:322 length:258 start_codon:yes stop_codon:yes gene_type:complete